MTCRYSGMDLQKNKPYPQRDTMANMTPDQLFEQLLEQRGWSDPDQRELFLNPRYEEVSQPFLLSDMETAVERIMKALSQEEKIAVYTDYDVDGISSAIIFRDFLEIIGYENFVIYIPHRHDEGYGFHVEAVEKLAEEGTQLIITADVGITAIDAGDKAHELGVNLIITDHHEPLEKIPKALAIINPKIGEYPDRMLCGAAVAWQVVRALLSRLRDQDANNNLELGDWFTGVPHEGWEKWLVDLVGMATISDMVPLLHENRILAHYGLLVLRKSPRVGIQQLLAKARVQQKNMTEEDVGFTIGPKVNVASRLATPQLAYELLSAREIKTATTCTEELFKLNDRRKVLVSTAMRSVNATLERRSSRGVIVIGQPEWNPGILSLIASRIVDTHGRPAFVWSTRSDGSIKGSCRSDGSCSVLDLLGAVPEGILSHYGGHAEAAGFATDKSGIHVLETHLLEAYEHHRHPKSSSEKEFDFELSLSDVTWAHWHSLKRLAPFGMANPKPVFLFAKAKIVDVRIFGKTREHVEVFVTDETRTDPVPIIAFFVDNPESKFKVGQSMDLLASFDVSWFRGRPELRLMFVS
jgi:single-stranded-DNA-specific exonuclease